MTPDEKAKRKKKRQKKRRKARSFSARLALGFFLRSLGDKS